LAAPILLVGVGGWLTDYFQKQSRQNEIVNKYFEQMEQLIVDKKIDFVKSKDSVKTLIKGKSLATLRSVDNSRKEIVLSFLSESDLLNSSNDGISLSYFNLEQINLSGFNLTGINLKNAVLVEANLEGSLLKLANLNHADLSHANLWNANLSEARLSGANLSYADLSHIDLSRADLSEANLSYANLSHTSLSRADLSRAILGDANLSTAFLFDTNLSRADLSHADLSHADLSHANLSRADFSLTNLGDANLSRANLSRANLSDARNLTHTQIKSACHWETALYTESTRDNNHQQLIVIDKEANQKEIDKIKQDKASNPQTPPDCRDVYPILKKEDRGNLRRFPRTNLPPLEFDIAKP
jgi:uncharacterized protein YjbI with pentapeptide repeats